MRRAVIGAGTMMLASCTLLVPIDDDLTSGSGADAGKDGAFVEIAIPRDGGGTDAPSGHVDSGDGDSGDGDSGEPFGPPREGCPNGVLLDPDLAGYYPFDETDGITLHDCSANEIDLERIGTTASAWVDGHRHGAGDFNGTEGCFSAAKGPLNAFEGQPFTVAVWVLARQFFENDADKSGRWIVSHKISPHGWHVGTDDPSRLELDLESGAKLETSASAVPSMTWVHFATTYNPDGHTVAYLNGGRAGAHDNAPATFDATAATAFQVGCRSDSDGVFDGKIDELRIYKRILTDAEIAALAAR